MPRWIQHSLRCIWVSKFVNITVFFWEILHEVECLCEWVDTVVVVLVFLTLIGLYTKKLVHAFKLWKHILVCVQFFVIQYSIMWEFDKPEKF